jgi:hypothetical protein
LHAKAIVCCCKLRRAIGGGVTKQVRGYRRQTDHLPDPHTAEQSPGEGDTSTPHVLGKVVSQLEMDSRWALARSVRALVAERDALKDKLDGTSIRQTGAPHVEVRNF